MDLISRRQMLVATAASGLLTTTAAAQGQSPDAIPQPQRQGRGGTDPGPRNVMRDRQNPDLLVPPATDHGSLPNLRYSFSDAHMRLETGGWTRQVTQRELGIAKALAGVNMRLNAGGVRELHWHKASEWAYMLYGTARVTAMDPEGRYFIDDIGVGDLWFFPGGTPHSIQGLGPDGCEFLLVFDDGDFDEDNTFMIADWFKRTPDEVLAKNFAAPASAFARTPEESQRYIFPAPLPGPLRADSIPGATPTPTLGRQSHRDVDRRTAAIESDRFDAADGDAVMLQFAAGPEAVTFAKRDVNDATVVPLNGSPRGDGAGEREQREEPGPAWAGV
jgi:oxalate decarboxylase